MDTTFLRLEVRVISNGFVVEYEAKFKGADGHTDYTDTVEVYVPDVIALEAFACGLINDNFGGK